MPMRYIKTSLGNLQPEKNEVYSKKISEWLNSKLGLKNDRGYIVFNDPGNAYIGCVPSVARLLSVNCC